MLQPAGLQPAGVVVEAPHRRRGSPLLSSKDARITVPRSPCGAANTLRYPIGMFFAGMRKNLLIVVFSGLMAVSLAALLLVPPIPQDQSYYQFADQRTIFGIPNFGNVVSNPPFLAVGAAGLLPSLACVLARAR